MYRILHIETAYESRTPERPLTVRQVVRPLRGQWDLQVNAVSVALTEPLDPGADTTLQLAYSGTLVGYREAMPYVHDSVQREMAVLRPEVLWYPILGSPTLSTYKAIWSVPESVVTVRSPKGWYAFLPPAASEPVPGGAQRFLVQAGALVGLHLFCGRYESSTVKGVSIYHLPGNAKWASEVASATEFATNKLREWLGPPAVPTRDIAFLELPTGWGSQHLPGLITQTVSSDPALLFAEVAHEVAHFWTPGIGPDANRFCDEAIAHYLEDLLLGERDGIHARQAAIGLRLSALRSHPEALSVPLAAAAHYSDLPIVSRQKGPLALAILEVGIGRTALFDVLHRWIASSGSARVDAEDFVRHVTEVLAGQGHFDVSRFLREWFMEKTDLSLSLEESPDVALRLAASRYALSAVSLSQGRLGRISS
jgi:hypothetical protein